jgi:O-antigen ligase
VLAFFGWAWVSALHAEVLSHGVLAALNLSKYLVVYLLVSEFVDSLSRVRAVVGAAACGFSLQLIVAFLQVATRSRIVLPGMKTSGEERLGYVLSYDASGVTAWRPSGLIQHPNFFADYLVVFLPTLLVLTLLGADRIGKRCHRIAALLLVGGAVTLGLTLSRGGWIGFAAAGAAAVYLTYRRGYITRRIVVRTVGVAVLGGASVIMAYPPIVLRLFKSDERSTESRLLMMEQALQIVRQHPVVGVGLATYTRVAKRSAPPEFARYGAAFREALVAGVVHNGYLALWAERGSIGLGITLALYLASLRAAVRVREWQDSLLAGVTIGLTAALVGQLALYNFDHFYLDSRPGVLWLIFGVLAASLRLRQQALGRPSQPGWAVSRERSFLPGTAAA